MGFLRIGTGRDAADVAFATILGNVSSMAPYIDVRVLEGPGVETHHHRSDAISTSAASLAHSQSDATRSPCRADS